MENHESRLQRLEQFAELIAHDHDEFRREHRQLLTAQVLLTDAQKGLAEAMTTLALKSAETEDKLNALIHIVQGTQPPQK